MASRTKRGSIESSTRTKSKSKSRSKSKSKRTKRRSKSSSTRQTSDHIVSFAGAKRLIKDAAGDMRVSAEAVAAVQELVRRIATQKIEDAARLTKSDQRDTLLYRDLQNVIPIEHQSMLIGKEDQVLSGTGGRTSASKNILLLQSLPFKRLAANLTGYRVSKSFIIPLQHFVEQKVLNIISVAARATGEISNAKTLTPKSLKFVELSNCNKVYG